nr:lisH domain-containing protein C1711.05-like [Ipomoea batatas]
MADEEEVTSQNHSSNYSSESIYQENPREAFERMVKSFNDIEDSHFKLKEENAKLLAERQDLEDLRSKNVEMLEYISQLEKQVHLLKEECKAKDDREQNLRVETTITPKNTSNDADEEPNKNQKEWTGEEKALAVEEKSGEKRTMSHAHLKRIRNEELLASWQMKKSQLEKQVHLLKEECKAKDDREQNLRVKNSGNYNNPKNTSNDADEQPNKNQKNDRRRKALAVEEKSGEKNDESCTFTSSSESDSSEDEKGLLCLFS